MPMPKVKGSITNGTSKDRDDTDFYETPRSFTAALLDRERFSKQVWEPGAGACAITDVLEARGHRVRSTDIRPRDPRVSMADFLKEDRPFSGDIVTNPPFSEMIGFVTQALRLSKRKVAVVAPISVLNSGSRYKAIWSWAPVSRIILAGRYQHVMTAKGPVPSQFSHVWVVFDKQHDGKPVFEWLPDVVYRWDDPWK